MKPTDETGKRYGRLTVIRRYGSDKGNATWLCVCDCGVEKIVRGTYLRTGKMQSCGCLEHETRVYNGYRRMRPTHGMSKSRLHDVWHGMKARCYRKTHPHYKDYGGRGISVCDEWVNDFYAFAAKLSLAEGEDA